jgi:hypothetical protein
VLAVCKTGIIQVKICGPLNLQNVARSFWCLAEAKVFSSSHCVQNSSEAHPASYPVGTRGPSLGAKAHPGHDSDYSLACSAKVKNE